MAGRVAERCPCALPCWAGTSSQLAMHGISVATDVQLTCGHFRYIIELVRAERRSEKDSVGIMLCKIQVKLTLL
jgi:hypothetical protein